MKLFEIYKIGRKNISMFNVGKYRNKSKCTIACLRDTSKVPPPPLSTLASSPFSNRAAYINSLYNVRTTPVYTEIIVNKQFGRREGTSGTVLSNF